MSIRPLLLLPLLLALAACGDDGPRDNESGGAGVNVVAAPPAPAVEPAPAVKPRPVESAAERNAAVSNVRDGPGQERGPEYEGARGSATSLPSQEEDAPDAADATPPPPAPPPSAPSVPG